MCHKQSISNYDKTNGICFNVYGNEGRERETQS